MASLETMNTHVVERINRMDAKERGILMITCFGHLMSHFNMLVFPALLLPLTKFLNMEMSAVLGLSFWGYLLFGISTLPWGMATDRLGPMRLMFLFYLGSGLCGLCAAFWMDSPTGLMLSLAGIGLFSGIYHPAGLGWISKDIRRVSIAMGYNGMSGNIGMAAAPLLTGFLTWLWGPCAAFIALGILNLSGALVLLFFPKSQYHASSKVSAEDENTMISAFVILLVAMMLGGIAYSGSTVIIPAYFELKSQEIFQWLSAISFQSLSRNLVATAVTSFIYIVGILGQYVGGVTAERFDLRKSYLVFHVITIPAVFLMGKAADVPLVMLTLIYFFFLLGMQPVENTLVARLTPKKFHHAAYGVKFVLTFGVGSLAVKMVSGVQSAFGIDAVFTALAMVSLMLVATVLILIRVTKGTQV